MVESWTIGIILRATSNLTTVMTAGARSTVTQNGALKEQNRLLAANAERQRILRSQIALYGGSAALLGAGIVTGVRQASALQQSMVGVQIATHATSVQLRDLQGLAVQMSGVTAQSIATVAEEMKAAATGGLTSVKQLTGAFPLIAKAADVLWISHGTNPIEAVKELTQLTHLYGHYRGRAFTDMINSATKLMFVQPEGLQAVVNQSRLFVPIARTAGISQKDLFGLTAAMGLTGFLKGRGGAGAARTIEYLLGAQSVFGMSAKQHQALGPNGLNLLGANGRLRVAFEDKRGAMVYDKIIDYLEAERKRIRPADFAMALTRAFLTQGGRFYGALLMPSTYAKFKQTQSHMAHMANVEQMWRQYSNTVKFAVPKFFTNVKNVLAAVFLPTLPAITKALNAASAELGKWTDWLMKRPRVALGIATVAFAATIGAALAAARAVWQLNTSLGVLSTLGKGRAGIGVIPGGAAEKELREGWSMRKVIRGILGFVGLDWVVSLIGKVLPKIALPALFRLGGLGADAIPGVGWIAAAVTAATAAVNALPGLITRIPTIVTAIHNWWVTNRYGIGQTIGYAFGEIAKLIKSAILGILHIAWAAISTTAHNWWLLSTPGGQAELGALIALNQQSAQKDWLNGMGSGFGSGFGRGWNNAWGVGVPQPHHAETAGEAFDRSIHIGQIVVPPSTDPKDLKKIAGYVLGGILAGAKGGSDTTGIHFPVTPHHPASAFGSP